MLTHMLIAHEASLAVSLPSQLLQKIVVAGSILMIEVVFGMGNLKSYSMLMVSNCNIAIATTRPGVPRRKNAASLPIQWRAVEDGPNGER